MGDQWVGGRRGGASEREGERAAARRRGAPPPPPFFDRSKGARLSGCARESGRSTLALCMFDCCSPSPPALGLLLLLLSECRAAQKDDVGRHPAPPAASPRRLAAEGRVQQPHGATCTRSALRERASACVVTSAAAAAARARACGSGVWFCSSADAEALPTPKTPSIAANARLAFSNPAPCGLPGSGAWSFARRLRPRSPHPAPQTQSRKLTIADELRVGGVVGPLAGRQQGGQHQRQQGEQRGCVGSPRHFSAAAAAS